MTRSGRLSENVDTVSFGWGKDLQSAVEDDATRASGPSAAAVEPVHIVSSFSAAHIHTRATAMP